MELSNLISFTEELFFYENIFDDSFEFEKKDFLFLNENEFSGPLDKKSSGCLEKINDIFMEKQIESDKKDNDSTSNIFLIEKPKDFFSSTHNSSKFPENFVAELTKNNTFKTVLYRKRGRKEKNQKEGKKCHGCGDFDNIQRKIQVSFINFLINFANDAIKTFLGKNSNYFFKDVKYEFKKVVNHKYAENLKLKKYSDIVQLKVSPKNRNYSEDANKETYLEICKKYPDFQQFFDKNYLYIFQTYFCKIKSGQTTVDFDGMKIKLSSHTKGLDDLLRKNIDYKEKFKEIVKNVYFSGTSNVNKNIKKNSNPFKISL